MRLIDADVLQSEYKKYHDGKRSVLIDVAPTIDAVEVVRCKDCKHRDPEDKRCDCGHDIMWQLPRDDNWFCADAERRSE